MDGSTDNGDIVTPLPDTTENHNVDLNNGEPMEIQDATEVNFLQGETIDIKILYDPGTSGSQQLSQITIEEPQPSTSGLSGRNEIASRVGNMQETFRHRAVVQRHDVREASEQRILPTPNHTYSTSNYVNANGQHMTRNEFVLPLHNVVWQEDDISLVVEHEYQSQLVSLLENTNLDELVVAFDSEMLILQFNVESNGEIA